MRMPDARRSAVRGDLLVVHGASVCLGADRARQHMEACCGGAMPTRASRLGPMGIWVTLWRVLDGDQAVLPPPPRDWGEAEAGVH